jgi:hypothetical protein
VLIVGSFFTFAILLIDRMFPSVQITMSKTIRKIKSPVTVFLIVCFSFSLVAVPVMAYAETKSNGDLLNYWYLGSNYRDEISAAIQLNSIADEKVSVMTFLYTNLYHFRANTVNLMSPKLLSIEKSDNITLILDYLKENNIRYVIAPTKDSWSTRYNYFVEFNNQSQMLRLLYNGGYMLPVVQNRSYVIYRINFEDPSYFKFTGFSLGSADSSSVNETYAIQPISNVIYTVKAGDKLQYSIAFSKNNPDFRAGVDIVFSDGTKLSGLNLTDYNGVKFMPSTDLTSNVTPDGIFSDEFKWYTRTVDFPLETTGKTVVSVQLVLYGPNEGIYSTYFSPIGILNVDNDSGVVIVPAESSVNAASIKSNNFYSASVTSLSLLDWADNLELNLKDPTVIAATNSLDNWTFQEYLSKVSTGLEVTDSEQKTRIKVDVTNLTRSAAATATYTYSSSQKLTSRFLSFDLKYDVPLSGSTKPTLRVLIRDGAGHYNIYTMSLKDQTWATYIADLSNPSESTVVNLADVRSIAIQLRNLGSSDISRLSFYLDNLAMGTQLQIT